MCRLPAVTTYYRRVATSPFMASQFINSLRNGLVNHIRRYYRCNQTVCYSGILSLTVTVLLGTGTLSYQGKVIQRLSSSTDIRTNSPYMMYLPVVLLPPIISPCDFHIMEFHVLKQQRLTGNSKQPDCRTIATNQTICGVRSRLTTVRQLYRRCITYQLQSALPLQLDLVIYRCHFHYV